MGMTIEAGIDGQKWTGVANLNQGEMKLNLKVDSEFTGKHYTLDFDLNPAGLWGLHVTGDVDGPVDAKWTMQKDFTMGEIVVKYKNQNYAFMQLKGNAEMRALFPRQEHPWTLFGTLTSAPGTSMTMTSRSTLS